MDVPNAGWKPVIIAITQVSNILPARCGESVRWNALDVATIISFPDISSGFKSN